MSAADPVSSAAAIAGPGRLQALSRTGVLLLFALAVVNGLFLYLMPAHAKTDYAWPILPPVNAAFMGAGYLAGVVATGLVVFAATSWRSLRVLPAPLFVLSVVLLAATLIHSDRFRGDYVLTWLWVGVYGLVPIGVVLLWRRQERTSVAPRVADPALATTRACSAVLGGVLAAVAVVMFASPATAIDAWPWPLTPLLSRVLAGWYALVATALIGSALTLRRPHEAVIPYATLFTWSALLLALPVLYAGDLADRPAAIAIWVVAHVLLLALAAHALARSLPLMRARGEQL